MVISSSSDSSFGGGPALVRARSACSELSYRERVEDSLGRHLQNVLHQIRSWRLLGTSFHHDSTGRGDRDIQRSRSREPFACSNNTLTTFLHRHRKTVLCLHRCLHRQVQQDRERWRRCVSEKVGSLNKELSSALRGRKDPMTGQYIPAA